MGKIEMSDLVDFHNPELDEPTSIRVRKMTIEALSKFRITPSQSIEDIIWMFLRSKGADELLKIKEMTGYMAEREILNKSSEQQNSFKGDMGSYLSLAMRQHLVPNFSTQKNLLGAFT